MNASRVVLAALAGGLMARPDTDLTMRMRPRHLDRRLARFPRGNSLERSRRWNRIPRWTTHNCYRRDLLYGEGRKTRRVGQGNAARSSGFMAKMCGALAGLKVRRSFRSTGSDHLRLTGLIPPASRVRASYPAPGPVERMVQV
jgi:hypothetical protein